MTAQYAELVNLLLKIVVFAIAIPVTIWAVKNWLKAKTEVHRAPCGFMTLQDIEAWCEKRESLMFERIDVRMDGITTRIEGRVDSDKEKRNVMKMNIKSLTANVSAIREKLGALEKELPAMIEETMGKAFGVGLKKD